jgi:hypothetical protein
MAPCANRLTTTAHATATLQAEIEKLRAEVDALRKTLAALIT